MKSNENGITLVSLVVTVVVFAILAGVLINISIDDGNTIETMNEMRNSYYTQEKQTQNKINEMTNGWEEVLN